MDINYNIRQLNETRYSFELPFGAGVPEKKDIMFGFRHRIGADKESSSIIIEIVVTVTDKTSDNVLAENGIMAVFGIDPFEVVVLEANENGIKVSEPRLIDTFINISIGALRGMLAKNFKQTPLEGCILPLIPMEAVHKMFTLRQ